MMATAIFKTKIVVAKQGQAIALQPLTSLT